MRSQHGKKKSLDEFKHFLCWCGLTADEALFFLCVCGSTTHGRLLFSTLNIVVK
jgi:hypothetical protein